MVLDTHSPPNEPWGRDGLSRAPRGSIDFLNLIQRIYPKQESSNIPSNRDLSDAVSKEKGLRLPNRAVVPPNRSRGPQSDPAVHS